MKKILSVLILTTILVFPMLVLAQGTTILEKCTLKHSLGERLCKDLLPEGTDLTKRLAKDCKVQLKPEPGEAAFEYRTGCELECPIEAVEYIVVKDTGVICLLDFIHTISDWIFAVFLVIAVIFLVMAGIQFVTAGGAPEAVTQARTKIIYAVVGLAVAFVARGIVNIIEALVA